MMTNDPVAPRSGEERHRARSMALMRYCMVVLLAALVIGVASGYIGSLVAEGQLPAWLIYITSAVMMVGFLWFSRDYLHRVDELDRMANLWAGLIGFTFYYVAFPVWNALQNFGLAPPVNDWALWLGTTIVVFAAYVLRKAGLR